MKSTSQFLLLKGLALVMMTSAFQVGANTSTFTPPERGYQPETAPLEQQTHVTQTDSRKAGSVFYQANGTLVMVTPQIFQHPKDWADTLTKLDTPLAKSLLKAVGLTNIKNLRIKNKAIGVEGVRLLVKRFFSNLEALSLEGNAIGDEGVLVLSGVYYPLMQYLNLSNNGITAKGAEALKKANWSALKRLILDQNPLGAQGVLEMIGAPIWGHILEDISLESCQIGDEGFAALAKGFGRLHFVRAPANAIGPVGLGEFLRAGFIPNLRVLELQQNALKTEGASRLAEGCLRSLEVLNISENDIGTEGVRLLLESESLKLHTLSLCGNAIGDAGAYLLARGGAFTRSLHHLHLANNGIGDEGALALASMRANFPKLKVLDLQGNSLSQQAIATLCQAFQGVEIKL